LGQEFGYFGAVVEPVTQPMCSYVGKVKTFASIPTCRGNQHPPGKEDLRDLHQPLSQHLLTFKEVITVDSQKRLVECGELS
jgi:hypothetical protein